MKAVSQPPQAPAIRPMQGERQDSFVERANRALQKSIPDPDQRMTVILRAWLDSGAENNLQERTRHSLAAIAECDPDEIENHFVSRFNRPVFVEHEQVRRLPDGRQTVDKYDRQALAAIAANLNQRIADTGDLSAISHGHTPTPGQQAAGMEMPACLGFSGPFRLGIVGRQAPKWAILADEHFFKDDWPQAKKLTRRSVEISAGVPIHQRTLDPIAVLGSEPPRLDLGLSRFSRRLAADRYAGAERYRCSMGDDMDTDRYDASGAAMPGGANTFTPSGPQKRDRYMDPATNANPADSLPDSVIQQIVSGVLEAFPQTPWGQWIESQMQLESGPVPPDADDGPPETSIDDATAPDGMNGSEKVPDAGDAGDANNAPGGPTPAPDQATPPAPAAATEPPKDESESWPDDEKAHYSTLSPEAKSGYKAARARHCKSDMPAPAVAPAAAAPTARYSKSASEIEDPIAREHYSRLERELADKESQLATLRSEQVFTARYSKLADLATTFELDPKAEAEEFRTASEAEFNKHLDRITKRYSRRDPMGGMPDLVIPHEVAEDDEVTARYSRRAVEIYTEHVNDGKHLTHAEAMRLAKAEK